MHRVCQENDLAVGDKTTIKVNDEEIIVYRLDDGFYATQAKCTHLFKNMSKGKVVDDCKIQCPLHRARFDIRTGEVVDWANFPPGVQLLNAVRKQKALKTYPVKIEDGEVFVLL